MSKSTTVETISGRVVDLYRPLPSQMDLGDMAYSLAREHRFGGHTLGAGYSVAEHSLWAWHVLRKTHPEDVLLQAHGLFHDASEYLTGDVPAPLKEVLRDGHDYGHFDAIEQVIQIAIYQAFEIPPPTADQKTAVKVVDLRLRATEHRALRPASRTVDFGGLDPYPQEMLSALDLPSWQSPCQAWEDAFLRVGRGALQRARKALHGNQETL